MKKDLEMSDPKSCLNKAKPDEMLFVLLERDHAAPKTIRTWIRERIKLGLNSINDPQILEAEACASYMESSRRRAEREIAKTRKG